MGESFNGGPSGGHRFLLWWRFMSTNTRSLVTSIHSHCEHLYYICLASPLRQQFVKLVSGRSSVFPRSVFRLRIVKKECFLHHQADVGTLGGQRPVEFLWWSFGCSGWVKIGDPQSATRANSLGMCQHMQATLKPTNICAIFQQVHFRVRRILFVKGMCQLVETPLKPTSRDPQNASPKSEVPRFCT